MRRIDLREITGYGLNEPEMPAGSIARWVPESDFEKACFSQIVELATRKGGPGCYQSEKRVWWGAPIYQPGLNAANAGFAWFDHGNIHWDDQGLGEGQLRIEWDAEALKARNPERAFNIKLASLWGGTGLESRDPLNLIPTQYKLLLWMEEGPDGNPKPFWLLENCPLILEESQSNCFPYNPTLQVSAEVWREHL